MHTAVSAVMTAPLSKLDAGIRLAIGIISNTVLKLVIGVSLGAPAFRKVLAPGLRLIGAILTLTLAVG